MKERPRLHMRGAQGGSDDHVNPHGIPRPRLPLSTKTSRMGRMIAEGVKGMVYGRNTAQSTEAMDTEAQTPYVEPDPAPPTGMKRPVIKTNKD